MKRRDFITLAGGTALAWPFAAEAQRQVTTRRVGYMTGSTLASRMAFIAAFRARLEQLGFSDGHNLILDLRSAETRFERLPGIAHELLTLKPDVLFATTTPSALAAKAATPDVPIVFAGVADPIGVGLVDHLARPGANITGVTNIAAELTGKRIQLLKDLLPSLQQVAVLVNPDDANASLQMRSGETVARQLGITLGPVFTVRMPGDAAKAIAAAVGAGAQGALRLLDPTLALLRQETVEAAARHKLPIMFPFREDVEGGGLIAYGTNLGGQYAQAAGLVAKILTGNRPTDLPVEQATTFELVVNQKTARALGLDLPIGLLASAHIID